ncbi:serine hydrolase domain-containing protein [Mucilaginibacter terrae]|uniref:CubicO group peptidase (Beta-lactamase class C family) n=1 Tax=Mucilaginibacter terrae TaxID=1955052 RepID=A0ABU3GU44_9SPHI|nr:serine hydrolase [Mucilaginibacter terrae]MDT3403284.1 CubicO group peptidase (beta-lactamase class C family) [Mucilaginibacter terrae]
MRRNKFAVTIALLAGFIVLNTACAQIPPPPVLMGSAYVNEENLSAQSTVLLNNEQNVVPLHDLDKATIASVRFNHDYAASFDSLLNKYTKVKAFNGLTYTNFGKLSDDLKLYSTIILQVTDPDLNNPRLLEFIAMNDKLKKVVIAYWGSGLMLDKLNAVITPVLWCSRLSPVAAGFVAQAVFGGVAITQKLQKNMSAKYVVGAGFITAKTRLQYTVPEAVGIKTENLLPIDNIAREAMNDKATPGFVVLVAKDGKVILNKAYGYHEYNNAQPDKITDIFDLASVTKISATTMEVMRLVDEGKLSLDSTMGSYIAMARNTSKNNITVRELMLHQAGLVSYIPFYNYIKAADHSPDSSAAYPTKVTDGYYMRKDYYKDVMWPQMLNSALRTRGKYVYSDLSMYFMKEIVETVTATPLNEYVQTHFYNPLGMQTAGFLPRNRFAKEQIVPTENDTYFRHNLLTGYVHDQGAAMVGGVSGHAGLFASANDLAILFQMMLNGGSYGGTQYFKPETVAQFTAKQSNVSRRGLGFDRWDPEVSKHYPSDYASPETYGHTGYTGTCVWVDPKSNLVYIFLSNRVYPKDSMLLNSRRIRARVMDVVYEAIKKGMQ